MIKVDNIRITDIGPIKDLKLDFNPHVNIICGTNSVGKTTVLECISHLFTNNGTDILKKKAQSAEGRCAACIILDNEAQTIMYKINEYRPVQSKGNTRINSSLAKKVLSIKTARNFYYFPIDAIKKDPNKDNYQLCQAIESGINISDAKNWFINRYMFVDKLGSLSPERIDNYTLAMKCFSVINPDIHFSKVLGDSFDIMLDTPMGEIYFEYLSSGYKSIIYILFSIIKEIEHRFKDPAIKARDFDGIILIDEVDVHLHPTWQGRIMTVLSDIFPKAQFFVTTHSPHILQNSAPDQIIALENIEGDIRQRRFNVSEYGFAGWSVEEILNDVMGMEDTRSYVYKDTLQEFDNAMDNEDKERCIDCYQKLMKMLHWANPLRKILEIQMAGAGYLMEKPIIEEVRND